MALRHSAESANPWTPLIGLVAIGCRRCGADGSGYFRIPVQRLRRLDYRLYDYATCTCSTSQMMDFRVFGDPILFHMGSVPITETMVTSTGISVVLLGSAAAMRAYTNRNPHSSIATVTRLVVRWLDSLVTDIVGRPEPKLTLLAGSLFIFIAACNLAGQLPGVRPPTASLATTSALAVIVFLAVPGIRDRIARDQGICSRVLSPESSAFSIAPRFGTVPHFGVIVSTFWKHHVRPPTGCLADLTLGIPGADAVYGAGHADWITSSLHFRGVVDGVCRRGDW